jgi:uncharacterized repeat protein (TIGR02543 family)
MHIISSVFVLAIITFGLFAVAVSSPVSAEIQYGSTESGVIGDPNVVIRGTSDADEANVSSLLSTLTFSDHVDPGHWYVVYPDSVSAAADGVVAGDIVSVTYDGITYGSVTVFVGNQFDGTSGLGNIIADNTTIFFKAGEYSVSAGNGAYDRFYRSNLSLIGLCDTSESVVFDMGYVVVSGVNYDTRNILKDNFYVSNITFDAKDRGMLLSKNSMGDNYFNINGFSNVVFDNVVIKNISSSYGNKNVAINLLNADTVVFNNIVLDNWRSVSGCAPIQVNNCSRNVYFNDLTLDGVHGTQGFIKVEDGTTVTDNLSKTSVFFTGTLNLNNMTDSEKGIYVQDYKYDTVVFPNDLCRYAKLSKVSNGCIVLSNTMPVSSNSYIIFDLKDNTFVVKKNDTLTGEEQIQNIVDALAFIQKIRGTMTVEDYNIKYEVGSSLGAITLPEIKASISGYTGYWEKIEFNIMPVENINDDIRKKEVFVFDISSGSSISLPASNNRYALFNIDFDKVEKCTLQEVIEGITPLSSSTDPYESLYGTSNDLTYAEYSSTRSPLVNNATADTFQSCIFTSLVNRIEVHSTSSTWYVGDEKNLTASLTDTDNNSFTYQGVIGKDTADDNVPVIKWFSTDTSVATVDMDTGKVTVIGVGTVTIVAKAADQYNDGEIEKPWATYTLTSSQGVYTVAFDSNGGSIANPTTIDVTHGSTYGTLPVTSMEGYTFDGWYTALSGGTEIESSSIVSITSDITLYAIWTVNDYIVTYTVNGSIYTAQIYDYGDTITAATYVPATGYDFSGWSSIPSTMPAYNITVSGTTSQIDYTVTYTVDGFLYTTQTYNYRDTITAATYVPATGYDFSGWSSIPSTMPAYNITVSGITSQIQYIVSLNALNVIVAGITDGSLVTYGSNITFTVSVLDGYTDPSVTCTIGGVAYVLGVSVDTYTIVGTDIIGDIVISVTAVEKFKYTTEYDSNIFNLDVKSDMEYGKSFTADLKIIGNVDSYIVVVKMGGEVIPGAFTYNEDGSGGVIYIDSVTGDIDISVIDVQYNTSVSNGNLVLWISIAILMSLFIILLFYRRRRVIFDVDHVMVIMDGIPISNESRIHKGDIFTVHPILAGYGYIVSNVTISNGGYIVQGRWGNVVISSTEPVEE